MSRSTGTRDRDLEVHSYAAGRRESQLARGAKLHDGAFSALHDLGQTMFVCALAALSQNWLSRIEDA